MKVFNYPYISKSITEFWRRWHISLSTWFREYLYIPLGGNRRGNVYVNLFIVFLVTGIWHGAAWTYILWGILHGIFIVIERVISKKNWYIEIPSIIKYVVTMFIVLIGWVVFRADSLEQAFGYNDRGIKFLYTLEPSKSTIYPEYLPEGYIRNTENLDYFTEILDEKGINYLSNVDTLLNAKEEAQVFDPKYDAGHWNETGAIYVISAMIDRLNDLDSRVGSFDINRFEKVPFVNTSLMSSDFPIYEPTTHYEIKDYDLEYIEYYENEIRRHEDFRYYNHYVDFYIINEEVTNTDTFDLYFLSKDEKRYQKVDIELDEW